ncbi:MAG TPA: flippase [Patescibacteria group bacterium]|nr:flippase [Patescibacteria group bacterium]
MKNNQNPKTNHGVPITNYQELAVIAKESTISFSGNILGRGMGLIITLLLARLFGATLFGIYSLGQVIFNFSATIACFGLSYGAIRFVSTNLAKKDQARVKGALFEVSVIPLVLGTFIALILYLGAEKIALLYGKPELFRPLRLFAFGVPFFSLFQALSSATRGFKTTKYTVLGEKIITPFLNICLIILFYYFGLKIFGMIGAYIMSIIFGALFFLSSLKKLFPKIVMGELKPKFRTRKILKTSIPLTLSSTLFFLVAWTDIFMVGYFLPTVEVGVYRLTTLLSSQVIVFLLAINAIFTPFISEYHQGKKIKELESLYKVVTRWAFYFASLVFLIIAIAPRELLQVFGENYILGKNSMITLAAGHLISAGVGSVGFILIMTGYQNWELINSLILFILTLATNIILIPRFGIIGAAIATAFSIGLINIVRLIEVYKTLKIQPFNLKYFEGILAGVVTFLLVSGLKNYLFTNFHYLVSLMLSLLFVLTTFSLLLLIFGLEKEDRVILNKIKHKLWQGKFWSLV